MIRRVILALDVGNTNLTMGIVRGQDVVSARRAATRAAATADELELVLDGLLQLDGARLADADEVVLASVVPALTTTLMEIAGRHAIPLLSADSTSVPIPIRIDKPTEAGADRLVNALAAARLHGTPAIVVDFGTATNFDVVAADGAYIGGALAPGLELGLEALATRTAKLPRVALVMPARAIGRDTVSAIQSGAVIGYIGLVTELVRAISAQLALDGGPSPKVILTGGLSAAPWAALDPRRRRDRPNAHAARAGHPAQRGSAQRGHGERMSSLEGRLILLGVTGSIAAYKSAELVRALTAEGADVQVLMSHTAQSFIGPLTLQTLTRRRPMTDPLELLPDQRIAHIVAADSADLILVAPATAHWMAAMATGLAGDVITVTCLASSAPVVVAPAMDGDMYAHPATVGNVARLARVRLCDRRAGERAAGVRRRRPGPAGRVRRDHGRRPGRVGRPADPPT